MGAIYRQRVRPGHPLTGPKSAVIALHRLNLWDKIGPGPHPCHFCGKELTWQPGSTAPDALTPCRLDHDTDNDDPANLVPSCRGCINRWTANPQHDRRTAVQVLEVPNRPSPAVRAWVERELAAAHARGEVVRVVRVR